MKRIFLALALSLFASAASAATIATGPSDGSYFQIARDIKNVAGKEGMEIQVMSTKGSLENIQLLGTGKVDLAIVQLDALRFVSEVLKQQNLDLFDSIKVVLNVYRRNTCAQQQERHPDFLSARRQARVGGHRGGRDRDYRRGALVRLRSMKATVSFDSFDDAMKKLEQGNLDAVMFVGGAPVHRQVGRQGSFCPAAGQPGARANLCTNEPGKISISLVCNRY